MLKKFVQNQKKTSHYFLCVLSEIKIFAPVLHPLSNFFSFGVPKGKKFPLGHQMEKTSFGGPK